ncbi:hypothetical protein AJ85_08150, partial [Alkalihalobacillus alcalophilus ATCC 27647 = CGMCC 1.3604]
GLTEEEGLTEEKKLSKGLSIATFSNTMALASSFNNYFKADRNVAVYDNSGGTLVQVGTLRGGQVFPIISDYGNWHRISFGDGYGYVRKIDTSPDNGNSVRNKNNNFNNSTAISIIPNQNISVYDNSTGSLVPFGSILRGVSYPIINEYGPNWYRVDLGGRVGFIRQSDVKTEIKEFSVDDEYFETVRNTTVYDNSTGALLPKGLLRAGEHYPRVSDYGNWHRVDYGDGYGYIRKSDTIPSDGKSISNQNTSFNNSNAVSIVPERNISVYDNTSGTLLPFATIYNNVSYPIINEYGSNWYRVDVSGRVGFVRQSDVKTITKEFQTSDKYFEVIRNTTIYDNSTGSLVAKGTINAGEHYPRVSDYGNWHRIQYGNEYGYIRKADTAPSTGSSVKNENTTFRNSDRSFNTNKNVIVYDNTSGSLVPFATINNGEIYPFVNEYGTNWYRVIVADRVGFVRSADVSVGPVKIYDTTSYNYSLNEMLDRQMRVNPQTDLYRNQNAFVSRDFISTGSGSFPKTGRVTASTLNVREQANTNSWIFGTLSNGSNVNLVGQTGNWYEIRFGAWRSAKREDVRRYVDPNNFDKDSRDYLQFLQLSRSAGTSATELNKALTGKGVLAGTGAAFKTASETHSINEIYLIAHALLETGHGQSTLAKGIRVTEVGGKAVEPKVVYNMFGIGAFDGVAERAGAEYAYNAGWDTPEKAIIGGARFIGQSYINHPTHKQDTLYKMRWNPGSPATHQYATDIGWAVKQVSLMDQLYNQMNNYTMYFDVPKYK